MSPTFKQFLTAFYAILVILSYPVLGLVLQYQYPLFSGEIWVLLAAFSGISALLGYLLLKINSSIAALVYIPLATLSLFIHFNLLLAGFAVTVLVGLLAAVLLRKNTSVVLSMLFTGLIFGAYVDFRLANPNPVLSSPIEDTSSDLSPVLHIILDGQIGLDGLPQNDFAQRYRKIMMNFLRIHNFTIYPKAYSRNTTTKFSLSQAFNFTEDMVEQDVYDAFVHQNYDFEQNEYFDSLHREGYKINVIQSQPMQFCNSTVQPVSNCWTYKVPNLKTLHTNEPELVQRVKVLVMTLATKSGALKKFLLDKDLFINPGLTYFDPAAITAITDSTTSNKSGVVTFAHLIVPHAPFVRDPDCNISYDSEIWERTSRLLGEKDEMSERVWSIRYQRYIGQAYCAINQMDRIFSAIEEAGLLDRYTIVIHGDHGSGVSQIEVTPRNFPRLQRQNYKDTFSTLFAVKIPSHESVIVDETLPLEYLMDEFTQKITSRSAYTTTKEPYVYFSRPIPSERVYIDMFDDSCQPSINIGC